MVAFSVRCCKRYWSKCIHVFIDLRREEVAKTRLCLIISQILKLCVGRRNFVGQLGVRWNFNLTKTPKYVFFLKRLTEFVKIHLKIQLNNDNLSIDKLKTTLLETDRLLNNCAITYDYPVDSELSLTPNNLLCSRHSEPHSLNEKPKLPNIDPVTYSKQPTALLNQFWHRWRTEYLSEL